jgi:hypothetical protein
MRQVTLPGSSSLAIFSTAYLLFMWWSLGNRPDVARIMSGRLLKTKC